MKSQEYTYHYSENFQLESGSALPGFQLKYTTLGKLNTEKSNVVWVCHALTGSSTFLDWWGPLFNEGGPFNPNQYFIVCANVLGGCYGSTGPLSINPTTNDSYFHDFPIITNHDVIKAFDLLRGQLGIEKIHTLIGGSLGGQQVLSWAIYKPDVFENLIPIACNAAQSAWSIAINEAQRMAIEADKTWLTRTSNAGQNGLKAARAMSMITFRSFDAYMEQHESGNQILNHYKASSYQRHHGEKLANRFDAFSYWTLTKLMDNHDVGRNYPSLEMALGKITADALVVSISSDLLFPVCEQELIRDHIANAKLETIHSPYGHDAFLIETGKLGSIIHQFLKKEPKYILHE